MIQSLPNLALNLSKAFQASSYQALRQVDCRVVDGRLLISGAVPSFHSRQLALSLARQTVDVALLEDALSVGAEAS